MSSIRCSALSPEENEKLNKLLREILGDYPYKGGDVINTSLASVRVKDNRLEHGSYVMMLDISQKWAKENWEVMQQILYLMHLSPNIKNCPNCNVPIFVTSRFCSFCGEQQEDEAQAEPSPELPYESTDAFSTGGMIV